MLFIDLRQKYFCRFAAHGIKIFLDSSAIAAKRQAAAEAEAAAKAEAETPAAEEGEAPAAEEATEA